MTLVQLRHFIALAETASFRRAAEATFLTQPALSRSIKGLEDELGQPLFDRIGWRTELTPFGREMLVRARRLVAEAEHLKESAEQLQAGKRGRIRIGLGSGPGAILTLPLMQHVAQHLPGAHIDIAHAQTTLLAQGLRERQLDALVVDARSLPPAQDLHVQPLGELRGNFMVRPGHPLLAQRAPLRFRDVRRYPLATTPLSDEIGRIMVERYGPDAHLDECVTLRTEDIATLVQVALASDAVLLAVRAAAPALEELSVKPALAATARFGLVTLAGRSTPPLLEELRPMIETRLQE